MYYKLKNTNPSFRVVDGPFAGRLYESGKQYSEIPPQEAHKFDQVADNADFPVRATIAKSKKESSAVETDKSAKSAE